VTSKTSKSEIIRLIFLGWQNNVNIVSVVVLKVHFMVREKCLETSLTAAAIATATAVFAVVFSPGSKSAQL